jgi:hypothetical protein
VAYWNAWFERDRMPVSRIDVARDYRFVLDLSRYKRRPEAGVEVSAETRANIAGAERTVSFTIRVLFTGGTVRMRDGQGASISKAQDFSVQRLHKTDLNDAELRAWREGRLDTEMYLKKASAGQITFDVVTIEEGCGTVAISVWDGTGLRPLDHLTYEYAVGDAGHCPHHDRLVAGMGTLFNLSSFLGGGQPEKADAALHIFELPSGARDPGSVVWYVDRAQVETRGQPSVGVYAWQTQSSLKKYVQTPSQLPALLQAAREAAEKGDEWPYANVAEDMYTKLFSVSNERLYGKSARGAQAAIEKLVNGSRRPPVILVRLAVSADALDYLPLGLLASRAEKPLLRRPFVTVQPLRRERFYEKGKACVGPWILGIPKRLHAVEEALQRELDQFSLDPPWQHSWARDIMELRQRFKRSEALAEALTKKEGDVVRGEGLVLLGHHADGNLWFDQPLERFAPEHVERSLGPGSVAILSACSIGSAGPLSYALIEKLNASNIDTMIVSPFPVRAQFGARLALHFVREIDEARRSRRTPTIAELYAAAWTRTAKDFEAAKRDLYDMGLEFVILGDPNIRLCPD